MIHQATQKAVIYCRVAASSTIQKDDSGIHSQLTHCREFARHKGYEVVEVFHDEGVSGNVTDRPGLQAMLRYLGEHRYAHMVVLVNDIGRLARNVEMLSQVQSAIRAASGRLETPSIEFRETPDSVQVNLLAGISRSHA